MDGQSTAEVKQLFTLLSKQGGDLSISALTCWVYFLFLDEFGRRVDRDQKLNSVIEYDQAATSVAARV